jgi:hypothetical protein
VHGPWDKDPIVLSINRVSVEVFLNLDYLANCRRLVVSDSNSNLWVIAFKETGPFGKFQWAPQTLVLQATLCVDGRIFYAIVAPTKKPILLDSFQPWQPLRI